MENLSCNGSYSDRRINCSWSEPPAIIGGIQVKYTLNITKDDRIEIAKNIPVSSTQYSHSINDSGTYTVAVAAVVGVPPYSLDGKIQEEPVNITKGIEI